MQRSIRTEATWYRAMTLAERIKVVRSEKYGRQTDEYLELPNRPDDNIAQRLIQRWRDLPAFSDDIVFRRRLAMDNIDEEEFRCLISEPAEAVKSHFSVTPPWIEQLASAFGSMPSRFPDSPPAAEVGHDSLIAVIPAPVDHLISLATARLRNCIDRLRSEIQDLPFNPDTVACLLLPNLRSRLAALLVPTLALEVNVARLEGKLTGSTAKERFQEYMDSLRDSGNFLGMLREYPVLARQLIMTIDFWVSTSFEMLQRLSIDWKDIKIVFNSCQDPGELMQVETGMGDRHRKGRSVSVLKFASGFQTVYKPRSVAVDVNFQNFLEWINRRIEGLQFRTLAILDRDSYGWVEFVSTEGCARIEEIERFYERQGSYLAVLYILNARDIYCENLIAAGEHPILIDLESLFHPQIEQGDGRHAEEVADNLLAASVLGIGLLPRRIFASAQQPGIDLSGLGASAGQVIPRRVPIWEGLGTDQMRLIEKSALYSGADNRSSLNGSEVNPLGYVVNIIKGFSNTYQLLMTHRVELLSDDGPIARFANNEIRVILRDTQAYASLLQSSYHPDALRNALDRDRLFDRLWMDPRNEIGLERVISPEHEDLWRDDIPVFTTIPRKTDIWTSSGDKITDFLDEPSLSLVRRRLLDLSEDDLEKQIWIIRACFAIYPSGVDQS